MRCTGYHTSLCPSRTFGGRFFQPTIQSTKCDVLCDLRVLRQSPRSCKLLKSLIDPDSHGGSHRFESYSAHHSAVSSQPSLHKVSTAISSAAFKIYRSAQPLHQSPLRFRPLRNDDRISRRVTWNKISRHAVSAEDSFEVASDALNRVARALVANIGVKTNAVDFPGLERVRQHQQLGFGVGRSPNCVASKPRVTDLAYIGRAAPLLRVALRPGPAFDVEEARRANYDSVAETHRREGQRSSGVTPGQRCLNIFRSFSPSLRHGTPLIKRSVDRRRGG